MLGMGEPMRPDRQRIHNLRREQVSVIQTEDVPIVLVAIEILAAGERIRECRPVIRIGRIRVVSVIKVLAIPGVGERQAVLDSEAVIGLIHVGVLNALFGRRPGRYEISHQPRRVRRRKVGRDPLRKRADLAGGNQIAGVRVTDKTALPVTACRRGIEDRDQSAVRRLPIREVAVDHLRQRDGLLARTRGLRETVTLIGEEEPGLIAAVVHLGDVERSSYVGAEVIAVENRLRPAELIALP